MKRFILGMLLVLGMAGSAWANSYNLDLMIGNSALTSGDLAGYTAGYGTVDIDAAGKVTFSGNQNVSYGGNVFDFFLTIVDLNAVVPSTPLHISTSGHPIGGSIVNYASKGSDVVGDFGNFNISVGPTGSQGAKNSVQNIYFDLPSSITLKENNLGYLAAAHIVVFENGLALSDAIITGNAGDGSAPVPEPGTMMLLGAGFLGLAVYGKRKRNA